MNLGLDVLSWLQTYVSNPWLDGMMIAFSRLGNKGGVWIIITVVLLLIPKTRRVGLISALALIFSLLLCNLGLKPLVMRARPFTVTEVELLIPPPGDWSFPSGHTSASFAAAASIAALGRGYAVAAYALAALISFSRLYLFVHYPGDVLAGLALGLFCAWLARLLTERLWPARSRDDFRL
jgi:undecaprenyl-diphosphatase